MKILLIGYYKLDDGFKYASNALKKLDYDIDFFPMMFYYNEKRMIDGIKEFKKKAEITDIFLWWIYYPFEEVSVFFDIIGSKKIICYNWDPLIYPDINHISYNFWENNKKNREEYIIRSYKYFNVVPQEKGINIIFNPPGGDETISYYKELPEYKCDVSIICTNLYDNEIFPKNFQKISRKEIVDNLYKERNNIKFHIYGPNYLNNLYPDCYQGFIKYDDCYKVFSNSKVNLNIHVNSYLNENEKEYYSERLPQILLCKGLLFCDSEFKNVLIPGIDYILGNPNKYMEQIMDIISNSDNYNNIRESGYKKALKNMTWIKWANIIKDNI